ncbi:hypothetical protein R1flu_028935 [Riccia fluitans]|uniref:Uncharacterized protein n=1 Tax=Riccia fluitans TaxID=41844 RepID=A0ABD1XN69_9MARC
MLHSVTLLLAGSTVAVMMGPRFFAEAGLMRPAHLGSLKDSMSPGGGYLSPEGCCSNSSVFGISVVADSRALEEL